MWRWIHRWRGATNARPAVAAPEARTTPDTTSDAAPGDTLVEISERPRDHRPPPAVPAAQLFSPEAVQRAWLTVKRAGGGAGMDGVTIAQFEANLTQELQELQRLLASGHYRPKPVRQVWVPKSRGGLRPLALWALRDRVAQRVLYDLLTPVFEPHFLPCSFGFRPGLGVQDAVAALQRQRDAGLRWVVDADIEDCFGAIPTGRLLALIGDRVHDRQLRRYVRGWLEADIMNSADGRPRKAGASQGSVLSPLLANVYLHQIDLLMTREGLAFLRYADDFVISCRRRREAEAALHFSEQALQRWGLRLNVHKSRIVHLDQGLAWLGYFFVGNACYVL